MPPKDTFEVPQPQCDPEGARTRGQEAMPWPERKRVEKELIEELRRGFEDALQRFFADGHDKGVVLEQPEESAKGEARELADRIAVSHFKPPTIEELMSEVEDRD